MVEPSGLREHARARTAVRRPPRARPRPSSRVRAGKGADARCRGSAPGRGAVREPGPAGAVDSLESAALPQVAPELAEEQRCRAQLADRRDELLRRAPRPIAARTKSPTSSSLRSPSESRVRLSTRDRSASASPKRGAMSRRGRDGPRRSGAAPREPSGPAGEQEERLAVGPVHVVEEHQQRLRTSQRAEQLATSALQQKAICLGITRWRGGCVGEAFELGYEA